MGADTDKAAFEALRALPEAKALRAAAMYYVALREKHGRNHKLTRDAEENLYRQMFACHPVAVRALQALMGATG
jgi:hypothetical protein